MAHVHTKPDKKHGGETLLANQLGAIEDDRLHFWFSLDYIPGVLDADILLIHQEIGAFVIEVKAVPIEKILSIGYNHCHIEGRKPDNGPTKQAYNSLISLRDYLKPRLKTSVPFLVATACWPKISRHEWQRYWDDENIKGQWADSLLFEEDIYGSKLNFLERLNYIHCNPPIRSGAGVKIVTNDTIIQLIHALNPEARPSPTLTDLARLEAIERSVNKKILKDIPAGESLKVIFSGHPGTGKTFRLIHIGFSHAYTGAKVMFVCFNKTLASDIRRILSFHKSFNDLEYKFEIYDIFQLARMFHKIAASPSTRAQD